MDERLRLAAQPVGGVPHVEDLLVELALPGRPGVLEVVELVAEPVETLHHLGLVDHRLPLPATYAGRERAQSTPTAHPSARPTASTRRSDIAFMSREGARDHRQLWIP